MKRLILLKLITVLALCMSVQVSAATVVLEAGYLNETVPAGSYSFVVDDATVASGDISQTMTTTLLNQPAGSYTAVIEVCNDAGCNSKSKSYTIPDIPNVDDITLKITVSRD